MLSSGQGTVIVTMILQQLLLTTLSLQKTGSIKSQTWVGERDTLAANGFWETGSNCLLGFYPFVRIRIQKFMVTHTPLVKYSES